MGNTLVLFWVYIGDLLLKIFSGVWGHLLISKAAVDATGSWSYAEPQMSSMLWFSVFFGVRGWRGGGWIFASTSLVDFLEGLSLSPIERKMFPPVGKSFLYDNIILRCQTPT